LGKFLAFAQLNDIGHQDVKTISKRLGHTQTSTTMNIYVHALQESDQKASDALAEMLEKHSE